MLHITNGDSVVETLRAAELGGEVLPWRDVLHEGPVPTGLAAAELRDLRARWIAAQGWDDLERVRKRFAERDAVLEGAGSQDEVVLWFEHDLYDQLQLVQLLDRLGTLATKTKLSLICIDSFPGIERFIGLGQLGPEDLATLFPTRRELSPEQLRLGAATWEAFRSPDPRGLERLLEGGSDALPFLGAALRRHLAQFPSRHNGLARSEQLALEIAATGERRADQLFEVQQRRERHPFLGDSTFYAYLRRLAAAPSPLLEIVAGPPGEGFAAAQVRITPEGEQVLACSQDAVRLRGIDRWLGGVHLLGRDAAWRYDVETGALVSRRAAPRDR